MAETVELRVPDIGDFDAVEVIEVLIAPGDQVAEEQSLITLESDKATMEVPSSHAGTIREVLVKVGDKVSEGDLIARLELSGSQPPATAPQEKAVEPVVAGQPRLSRPGPVAEGDLSKY